MGRRDKSNKDDVMAGRTDSRNPGGRRPRSGDAFDPLDDNVDGARKVRKIRRMETGATASMRRVPDNSRASERRGATKRLPPLSQPPTGQIPKVPASAGLAPAAEPSAPGRVADLGVFGAESPQNTQSRSADFRPAQSAPSPVVVSEQPPAPGTPRGLSQRTAADLSRPGNSPMAESSPAARPANDSAAAAIAAARLPQTGPSHFGPASRNAAEPARSDLSNGNTTFDRLKPPDVNAPSMPAPTFDPLQPPAADFGPPPAADFGPPPAVPDVEANRVGSDSALPQYASSRARRQNRSGQGRSEQGRGEQGRSGQGRGEQGRSEQGRSEQGLGLKSKENQSSSLQDTEMKLAGRRRKPKPKEPNRLLLGAALAAALLVGGAVFYFTRGSSETETVSPTENTEVQATEQAEELPAQSDPIENSAIDPLAPTGDLTSSTVPAAAPAADVGGPLTFVFTEGSMGPLQADTKYPMEITGAPQGSMFQLVVNGNKQEQPEPTLRKMIVLPPGRHSIFVEVTGADGSVVDSNVADVYVLGGAPAPGFRANLSSVNVVEEGWAEAIRQFDAYRAEGHEMVQLAPSDPYPSLVPGYWNIFVDGFGDGREAAQGYCEQFSMAIPDECFPTNFDPSAPAKESTTATTSVDASDPLDPEADAMEDDS